MTMTTTEVLQAAKDRITPEERWAKRTMARDINGLPCGVLAPTAVQWCADGALTAALAEAKADEAMAREVRELLRLALPPSVYPMVTAYNDSAMTDYEAITALFDRAITASIELAAPLRVELVPA